MPLRLQLSVCLSLVLLGPIGAAGAADERDERVAFEQSAGEIDAYDFVEVTVKVRPPVAGNPFQDAVVTGQLGQLGQLDGAGGPRSKVEGFCDSADGTVYRIRFMPTRPGRYSYTVEYRQGDYRQSHSGTLTARDGKRRGLVRIDKAHPWHFVWEGTGEHYFWNGTTTYWLLGWQDENVIREAIDRLARLKVNRIRVALCGRTTSGQRWYEPLVVNTGKFQFRLNPWVARRPESVEDPGFDVARYNVPFWQKCERMLRHARDKGMVVSVIYYLDGADRGVEPFGKARMGCEDEQRYYRYGIARLAAFSNVLWDVTNEYHLFRNEAWTEQMGSLIKAHDPYGHLTSVHGHGDFKFRTSPWADFAMYQSWDEGGGHGFLLKHRQAQARSGRPMPQVNEEYGYEDHYPGRWGGGRKSPARSADNRRRLAWGMYMAGGYQTTGERADRGTGGGPDSGGGWLNGRGDDAMTMLEGYGHIVTCFTSLTWWKMEPRDDLVSQGAWCLAEPAEQYLVYLPRGGKVDVTLGDGKYAAQWFNPRNGRWTAIGNASGPKWTSPQSPDDGDWAIALRREAGENRPAKIWNRTGPLGETPKRTTEAYPLSDQENMGKWVRFGPMSDEFEGKQLDRSKWTKGMYWWKGRQPALFSDKNVTLFDGKLHLTMRKEKLPPEAEKLGYKDYTSAALHTKARSSYGYYEVKARPMNSGGSSSFWFQQDETPGWATEIDVFEIGGKAKGFEHKYHITLHVSGTPTEKKHWSVGGIWEAPWRLADDYHVYGFDWGKDALKFYVDGVLVRSVENTHWHQPLFLIFDSETMPGWFGMPDDKDLPSTFSVEYVRAWKRSAIAGPASATLPPAPSGPKTDERTEMARTLVDQMAAGRFDKAVEPFDDTMKRVLPADKLKQAWDGVVGRYGPFQRTTEARTETIQQYKAVLVTCELRQGPLDVKVVFTPGNKITGLFFVPSGKYQRPSYADLSKFEEREVSVGKGILRLPGTLSLPRGEGPFPALVLVHGSGPNDRDETIGPNKPFRDLAHGLASRGIAVLRYEKRTRQHPTLMALVGSRVTVKEETVDDAAAAVTVLASHKNIDPKRIFVLGHSLGGMLLPRIGRANNAIAGFISLAGSTRPVEDLVLEQTKYLVSLAGKLTEEEQKKIQELQRQVARVKSPDLSAATPKSELPFGAPPEYWLDLRGYEPAREARDLPKPMLILQGERDYQVTMEDFANWRKALASRSDVRLVSYPKLNHLFMEGEGKSRPEEYARPGNVAREVIEDIAKWITGLQR